MIRSAGSFGKPAGSRTAVAVISGVIGLTATRETVSRTKDSMLLETSMRRFSASHASSQSVMLATEIPVVCRASRSAWRARVERRFGSLDIQIRTWVSSRINRYPSPPAE